MISDLDLHRARDEETRRQICELLDETQFVEAGAGTGKTRALVDRYVALVRSGRRVERLVAITFTEKAAAELRDRIRAELERCEAMAAAEAPVLQRALLSLDRAQISTIHAFAMHVLRSFAAEHGIDPTFQVQDEIAAERRFEERWRTFLEEAGRDAAARAAVNRCVALGLWTRDLQTLAHELWSHGAFSELLRTSPLEADPAPMPDFEELQEELLDLNLASVPADDGLRLFIDGLLTALQQLAVAADEDLESLLAALVRVQKLGNTGRADNWGGRARIAQARDVAAGVCQHLQAILAALRSDALAQLMPVLIDFVVGESRARMRDGELGFDDLILQLRNLLQSDPDACRSLRARFDALMIDEFQDTDPLQVEIALAFACNPETGAIEPGRLFLVGDPKQSIYRFRRADMGVYARIRAQMEEHGGRLCELALNRRSRSVILNFVNQVFDPLIGNGDEPSLQPPYRPVHPDREHSCSGPGVALIGEPLDVSAAQARRREAQQIAAYCRAVRTEQWQIWDRAADSERVARYRDIAVLVPTRSMLQPLERAMAAAGVPYRVEGGSLIYATQEVRDLINCLTAIDDPTDDIAIVAALRSPAYACSDVDLAEYRLAGGSFNYQWPDLYQRPELQTWSGPVAFGLRGLRDFYLTRQDGSIAHLVERFIAERRLVEAGLYASGTRDAFRRARFVVEQARGFEAAKPESLRAFIEWLERRAKDAILDHEGAGLDDDEDAVRVLTIHGAKGLEFPIVFMAGLGVGPSNQPSTLGLDRADGTLAVSIGASARRFAVGPVDAINAHEKEHQKAERNRLLYVAATRARDHLLISLYHGARAGESGAHRLLEAGVGAAAESLPELPIVEDQRAGAFSALTVDLPVVADEAFEIERASLVDATKQPPVTSATALRIAEGAGEQEREDESEPWARGRAGTHRGRAVHAALQVLPWDADEAAIDALAQAQAVAEAVPGETQRIAELLRRALATDAAARARLARSAQREVPFAFIDQDVTLEGFIDLLLETDEGIEIIDWKTDAVSPGAVPRRLEDYSLQAGLYVLGVEAATGRSVSRVTYIFVDPGIEVSPGEPAALANAARERLHAVIHS